MDKMSFGQILRQTRERKGLDINTTARRLRIRPDILIAIENSDFAAMPPRGYTRNMVNGYARYLGLNPTEITGMYLDELYAYQVDYASSRQSAQRTSALKQRTSVEFSDETSTTSGFRPAVAHANARRANRDSYTDDYDYAPPANSGRIGRGSTRQARQTLLPNTEYTNFYSGPNTENGWRSKLPFIIAAAIALLLMVLLVTFLFGRGGGGEEEQVSKVPVTGVSNETGEGAKEEEEEAKAPTKFTFEYSLDDGATSWIEVYIDEVQELAESQTGPLTNKYESSGTLQFICASPEAVTVKIDGEEQIVQPGADGVLNMTVNFSDILAKWRSEHPGASGAASTKTDGDSSSSQASTDASATSTTDASQQAQQGTANTGNTYEDAYTNNDYTYSSDTTQGTEGTYDGTTQYSGDATYTAEPVYYDENAGY